jgi:hypothetical protein
MALGCACLKVLLAMLNSVMFVSGVMGVKISPTEQPQSNLVGKLTWIKNDLYPFKK